MSCGVGRRHGSDPALLWLWYRLAATALIQLLAWEPPHAAGGALKRQKKKKKKEYDSFFPEAIKEAFNSFKKEKHDKIYILEKQLL